MEFKLLIGTNNHGKVREYSRLLDDLPIVFTTPEQEGITGEPDETGASFLENALIHGWKTCHQIIASNP